MMLMEASHAVSGKSRLFATRDARLSEAEDGRRPLRAVGCWAFVHGIAMLALDDQLRMHLPGTDDASPAAMIHPLLGVYAGAGSATADTG
jgi:hypothetical protein